MLYLCKTPRPPILLSVLAIAVSVTVSIGELIIGVLIEILRVNLVVKSMSFTPLETYPGKIMTSL